MKFREHRSTVDESMKTLVELEGWEALIQHCRDILARQPVPVVVTTDLLKVELYSDFPDTQSGWSRTYIVTVRGWGVVGFTDSL